MSEILKRLCQQSHHEKADGTTVCYTQTEGREHVPMNADSAVAANSYNIYKADCGLFADAPERRLPETV